MEDKFHTTQAEGCCKKHLNNASLTGKLDNAESFECPKCGALYLPKVFGPMMLWEYDAQIEIMR